MWLAALRYMQPRRAWQPGDEYWALWIDATRMRYFPVKIGVVDTVEGDVVRMTNGDWRLLSEGLPFESLSHAERYSKEHPLEEDSPPHSGVAPKPSSSSLARKRSA